MQIVSHPIDCSLSLHATFMCMQPSADPPTEFSTEAKPPRAERAAPVRRAVIFAAPPIPQVRLRWLLSALGLLVLAALSCAYLSLCLLFLQGQWQLLYHPSRAVPSIPASLGLPYIPVFFAPNESGVAQLSGWWLPAGLQAESGSLHSAPAPTILYLHDTTGSLSDALPQIARLHALGSQVFAIDYRGFGASADVHPSEARMVEDARSAVTYLTDTRHIAPQTLVLWGLGTGATIAAEALSDLPEGSASSRIVLEQPNPSALEQVLADPRSRLLPARLLLRDRLDPTGALETSAARKLFLLSRDSRPNTPTAQALYAHAQGPKCLLALEPTGLHESKATGPAGEAKLGSEILSFLSADSLRTSTCGP